MTDQSVDPGAISVWRWSCAFAGAFILLVFAFVAVAARAPLPLCAPVLAALAVAAGAWTWWYPAAKYRHLAYRMDGTGITIRENVFWRVESSLARVRIQHTDVSQGPLQRHYGVATLKLYTAGSRFTKLELPGLTHATATALRDELQREGHGSSDGDSDAV